MSEESKESIPTQEETSKVPEQQEEKPVVASDPPAKKKKDFEFTDKRKEAFAKAQKVRSEQLKQIKLLKEEQALQVAELQKRLAKEAEEKAKEAEKTKTPAPSPPPHVKTARVPIEEDWKAQQYDSDDSDDEEETEKQPSSYPTKAAPVKSHPLVTKYAAPPGYFRGASGMMFSTSHYRPSKH